VVFKERYKELRILVDVKLRKLNTEIINRYRSHRFISSIYKLVQKGSDVEVEEEEEEENMSLDSDDDDDDDDEGTEHGGPQHCCVCAKTMNRENIAVLSCCGHVGHLSCVEESVAKNQTCGYSITASQHKSKHKHNSKQKSTSKSKSKSKSNQTSSNNLNAITLPCSVNASAADIIPVRVLGCKRDLPQKHLGASPSGKYGAKVTALIHLIQSLLLAEEDTSKEDKQHGDVRVVLFVQYSDLMHNIKQILVQEGIPTVAVEGSTTQEIIRADKAISGFKDRFLSSWSERVLILNSSDVSASGVTLVRANHVIFLHPLFAANQHEFDSKERQAIGRVRRPGQERDIHLYRFYVEHSLDHEILQDRYNISYLVLVKFFSVFFNF
jgi:SNF2 family DNA or RNA helicase